MLSNFKRTLIILVLAPVHFTTSMFILLRSVQKRISIDGISELNPLVSFNRTEKEVCVEPVPLSFDDLLMRNDVKVLAPRLHKDFLVNTFCIKFMTKTWLNGKANNFYTVMWKNLYPYGFERKNENVYLFLQIIHKDILQEVNNQITIQNQVKTVHQELKGGFVINQRPDLLCGRVERMNITT